MATAVVVARDDFTIDNAGLHGQCGRGQADRGKPVREVSAVTGDQPHIGRFPVYDEAKAIVLYLIIHSGPLGGFSAGRGKQGSKRSCNLSGRRRRRSSLVTDMPC